MTGGRPHHSLTISLAVVFQRDIPGVVKAGIDSDPGTDSNPGTDSDPGIDSNPGTDSDPGTDNDPDIVLFILNFISDLDLTF